MSQEELAGAAALDRSYVSQLERGIKSPTLTTLGKLSECLGVQSHNLLREPRGTNGPRVPAGYVMRDTKSLFIRRAGDRIKVPASILTSAINVTHELIDDLYGVDLDVATVLGMRNLSAFVGELFAAAVVKTSAGLFEPNPHQDGYPDLLLMDQTGKKAWKDLKHLLNEKGPFSPFMGGGIEIKATCGSVPTPSVCRKRGIDRPAIGDMRIACLTGYDWKAHHRDTNNLIGLLWDFIDRRPRIAAVSYSSSLTNEDWGNIVQPRAGGGRTTSVSIMGRSGIRKMYEGWLCVLAEGGYIEFLNRRNSASLIPMRSH